MGGRRHACELLTHVEGDISKQRREVRTITKDLSQVMDCIACLEDPGSMGNGLLIYIMG